jgi:hypothetical protein
MYKESVVIFDLDDTLIFTQDENKFFPNSVHKDITLYQENDPDFGDGSCGKCTFVDGLKNHFTVFRRGHFDYLIEILKSNFNSKFDICIFTASRMPDEFIRSSLKKLFGNIFENIPIFRAMYQESVESMKQYIGNRNFILIDDNPDIARFKISKLYDNRQIDDDIFFRHTIMLKKFEPFIYKPFQFEFNRDQFDIVNGIIFDNNHKNIIQDLVEEIQEKMERAYNKNIQSSIMGIQKNLENTNMVKMENLKRKKIENLKTILF